MKFGKKSIGAITAGLSLVMALAPVTPALADSQQANTDTGVTKVLKVNPGSSVNATFKYTATPTVLNANDAANKTVEHTVAATIADITLNANGAEATDTAAISYGQFPHAGVYAWVVSETADTYTGAGDMQYDPQTYTLVAVVNNGANGPEVAESYLIKGTATETSGEKVGTATFTNKYTEESNDGQNKPLVISKSVTGQQGDKTKLFTFTVTFTAPEVLPAGQDATSVVKAITATAKEGTTVSDLTQNADGSWTFKAADAGSVTFDNVLVGTTYEVTEAEANQAGYTTTGQVTEDKVLTENGASETVVNTKESTVVTGVLMNNAPFVVTLAVAAAGVVAYGAAKRKLEK